MNKDLILREKLAIQRTHLANQSTFLAFLRTSMYFFIAGLTVGTLTSYPYVYQIEITLMAISVTVLITGVVNYIRNKKKISDSEIHIGNYLDEFKT